MFNKNKDKKEQKFNKKEILTLLFLFFGISAVVIGGILIYYVLQPPPAPTPINVQTVIGIGFIFICIGIMIHGFNPLLLVKQK